LDTNKPGIAARIAYHRVGEFIEIDELNAQSLSELIIKVSQNSIYREKAHWFKETLGETSGLDVAADIIERVFRVGTPTAPSSPTPPTSEGEVCERSGRTRSPIVY
jgi:zeaxanthin glucosyltransferase